MEFETRMSYRMALQCCTVELITTSILIPSKEKPRFESTTSTEFSETSCTMIGVTLQNRIVLHMGQQIIITSCKDDYLVGQLRIEPSN